jgi:hypothetical protein
MIYLQALGWQIGRLRGNRHQALQVADLFALKRIDGKLL